MKMFQFYKQSSESAVKKKKKKKKSEIRKKGYLLKLGPRASTFNVPVLLVIQKSKKTLY